MLCLSGIFLSALFLDLRNAQQLAMSSWGCSLPGDLRFSFCLAGGRAVAAAGLGLCLKPSVDLVLNPFLGNLISLHFHFYSQAWCWLQPLTAVRGLFNNYLLLCDISGDEFSDD